MNRIAVLLVLLMGIACTKRKRQAPQDSEAAPAPPPAQASTTPSSGGHPGEPLDPAGVKQAYERFYQKTGQYPYSWKEMVDGKVLTAIPMGKNGQLLDFVQFTLWQAGYSAK